MRKRERERFFGTRRKKLARIFTFSKTKTFVCLPRIFFSFLYFFVVLPRLFFFLFYLLLFVLQGSLLFYFFETQEVFYFIFLKHRMSFN